MTTLEYFKTLAMELRYRKLSEDQIAGVLREVQSHLQDTGGHPGEVFGSPKEYAARFPKGTSVSRGSRIGYVAAAVLIILLGAKSFSGLVLDFSLGLPATLTYYATVVVLTAALVFWSVAVQRRLPQRMKEELARPD
jgi:hypothetical protein